MPPAAVRRLYRAARKEKDRMNHECPRCGGTGRRATARTANGRELERHERSGTPCYACGGSGVMSHCCGAIIDDDERMWTLCHRPADHTGPHSDEWPRR